MSFLVRIKSELLSSLKAKDSFKTSILKQLQSAIINSKKERKQLEEVQVLLQCKDKWSSAILEYKSLMKTSKDKLMIEKLNKIIVKEEKELEIINSLLPPSYSEQELKDIFDLCIKASSPPISIQKLMPIILSHIDPQRISKKDLMALLKKSIN